MSRIVRFGSWVCRRPTTHGTTGFEASERVGRQPATVAEFTVAGAADIVRADVSPRGT